METDWIGKEKRSIRGMCISYCKDLVVGNKLGKEDMISTAEKMFKYIWGG